MPINNLQELRRHIETAITVELSTVPPYLFAMYSIEDQSSEAALLLRSIVVEEMLHAALTTNLLLAVGGTPDYASTKYMTRYPSPLPHHEPPLLLDLAPCSVESIRNVFMRIEQPETHSAPAQPDVFETLGQFYHALEIALEQLSKEFDLFADPQRGAQLSDPSFYQPIAYDADDSGGLVLIEDLESAIQAIEIIVHQGEGLSDQRWADPAHQELTHYYKLLQIEDGTSPLGTVRRLRTNPRTSDYPDSIRPASDLFNAVYRGLYLVMSRMFSNQANQSRAVGTLYLLMADVLSQLASFLVERPIGNGEFAAPTFEVFEFTTDEPLTEIVGLANRAAELYPRLSTVHEAVRALDLIL